MASEHSPDIIIIGAGPVGLALALDLGRRGLRSIIIERQSGVGTELLAKASVINERTMEFCRMLGIENDIAQSGYPDELPGDTVFCTGMKGKFIGRLEMASTLERELPEQSCEMLRRCPQLQFDPILARAVERQGMTDIRFCNELVDISQDKEGVTCQSKSLLDGSSSTLRSRYVVACDGPGSRVRKALGISFEGKDLGYAISAIVKVDLTSRNPFGRNAERYMFISAEGIWANFTAIDGKCLWRFSILGGKEKVDLSTVNMEGLLRKALGDDKVEFELIRVDQWRRSQFTADSLCKGRIFLAGDSAHTMSPTGGHGLNTGFADAMTVGWILQSYIQGWGGPGLGIAYSQERLPVALRNGAGSTRNFGIWTDKKGHDKVLDDGDEAATQRNSLGERLAGSMRQEFQAVGLALGYNYADSPIIVGDGSIAPPNEPDVYVQTSQPGHRAPHFWLAKGKSTLDLFGDGFVLLTFTAQAHRDAERMVDAAGKVGLPFKNIIIEDETAAKLYEKAMVLVRPDGMVAWRGDGLPSDVESTLDRMRGAA